MRIFDSVGRKTWSDEDVAKYVGPFREVYFTYATDESLRRDAASGGSTTALLTHMLETDKIDGALVIRSRVENGKVECGYEIAQTREDLIAAQGSKYMAVRFGHDGLPKIRAFDGRLAAVLLPCDCTVLMRARQQDQELDRKIKLVIALVCGHNSERHLTDRVTEKLGRGHGELVSYRYRSGHWRGRLSAEFSDGYKVSKPFNYFSDYRNLYICAQRKCHACHDHFGYNCDISAGDIWSLKMRHHPIKHTALVTRTDAGTTAVTSAQAAGLLNCEREDVREILDGQSRTLPFHYNTTARARVGWLLGVNVKDSVREKVKWNDYVTAFIALSNERVSRWPWGRWLLLHIPRPVVRAYLYFFKGLELI